MRHLNEEEMAPGCSMGRKVGGGYVMLWAIFCWGTSVSAIHMDVTLTRTTYLNNVAGQVPTFMATVFPDGRNLIQQDYVQKWFEEITWPPNSPGLNTLNHAWGLLE